MERVAVYSGTRNVYADMLPACKSLFFHTPVDRVYFLIEDDKFPYRLPDRVTTVNVSGQKWFKSDGPNYVQKWSWMVLMRAVLSKVLPEEHVALSLDNDAFCCADVSELWDYDLTDWYFGAVCEPDKVTTLTDRYYNFGVNIQNLDKIRADKIDAKAIRELNKTWYLAPEQDVMNKICKGHILELPWKYNVSNVTNRGVAPRIRHHAAESNWRGLPSVRVWRDMAWKKIPNAWK